MYISECTFSKTQMLFVNSDDSTLEPCQPNNNSTQMDFQQHNMHIYHVLIANNESWQHWMRFDEHIEWCMHFFHWLYTFCIFIQIIPSNVGRIWYVILCDVIDWLCCILSTFALRKRVGSHVFKHHLWTQVGLT